MGDPRPNVHARHDDPERVGMGVDRHFAHTLWAARPRTDFPGLHSMSSHVLGWKWYDFGQCLGLAKRESTTLTRNSGLFAYFCG